jgi:hypothetical protein
VSKRYNASVNEFKNNLFKSKSLTEFKKNWKYKLDYDVYSNDVFKSHIKEVSEILNIEYEIIENVIKIFLESYLKFMYGFMDLAYKKFDFRYFILIIKRGKNFNSLYKKDEDEKEEEN